MSSTDTLAHFFHAMRHGDKLVETLLHGGHGSPFEGMGNGLLDRATMSDRRFWTGAAIGAAAILAYAAIVSKRTEPLASGSGGVKADGAEKRMNGRH
jgi:hypothetical protein